MAAFSLLAIVFRTILCMWPRPGGPNRIADSMPRASLDCDDAIDPCVCVLEAFLGAWDRIRQMFVVLVAMFHPVVHRRDCVRPRGGGRGGRRGIKFSAAPPSPQPGTGGFRESGRPLTAQDLDGLAVSWRLFWAWRTGGTPVSPANGSSKLQGIELTTSRTPLGEGVSPSFISPCPGDMEILSHHLSHHSTPGVITPPFPTDPQ